ncbi:MAG: ferrous iron transporter B [Flavobacteriales bacterium]|nr:ferrous iron transporter B [Flavobacteriales bacterium]
MSDKIVKNSTSQALRVLLVGNPNTGKSTLFNTLTELNQKVGNFPGVTVDKKSGYLRINDKSVSVTDLPGAYSLSPNSEDEKITSKIVSETENNDVVIAVADATNLSRNLMLVTQLIDKNKTVVLALNMMDLLQKNNQEINIDELSSQLGIRVIPLNAYVGKGIEDLKQAIVSAQKPTKKFIESSEFGSLDDNLIRYKKINQLVDKCIIKKGEDKNSGLTKKIDNILTHKYYGYMIFLSLMFLIFQAIFSWSSYPMEIIENAFLQLGGWLSEVVPQGILSDLIVNGIVAGLSGVVVFVPQIAILFAFIIILEDTGYMARVSFLMDKILRQFGLNGKSIIPLLSSTACAVPAIMSARTINNTKERLITIMVSPLISCSARIPVYTLLIAIAIPKDKTFGMFNLQGLLMMGLYLIGFLAALFAAWIMKIIIKSNEKSTFILEMPIYRMPKWKSVGLNIFSKVKVFLVDAGKIIIAISIVLWGLSSYSPGNRIEKIEEKYSEAIKSQNGNQLLMNQNGEYMNEEELNAHIASEKLEASYAGIIGKTIEPLIQPLGFDWKIGISLVTSFAAREVFVGTMATLYSVGDSDNSTSVREKMIDAKNSKTGEKLYTFATTISLLLFYAFAMQCMATLAVVYRETKSFKWPVIQLVYMGALAYFSSLLAYQLLS